MNAENINNLSCQLFKTYTPVEQQEFMQREIENSPSLLKFKQDIQEAQTQTASQAFGDSFGKKEEKSIGERFRALFGFGEEKEENPFEGILAYNDLIPQAKINATIKEYELMQKAFAEVA